MSAPTPAGTPTGPKTLTTLLHEYSDVVVTVSAAIPWSAMPPEDKLQWDDEGLVLPDLYLFIRGPKARVKAFFNDLDPIDPGLWLVYKFSYTDAPNAGEQPDDDARSHKPPRGAAPTSTTPFGVPAPGAGPVEAGTHGPTAPRGPNLTGPPAAPVRPATDSWADERAAAYSRSRGLGRTLALALTVIAALALMVVLTGCGETSSTSQTTGTAGRADAWVIETPDGRQVTCVSWKRGYAGGLDCDWGGTR